MTITGLKGRATLLERSRQIFCPMRRSPQTMRLGGWNIPTSLQHPLYLPEFYGISTRSFEQWKFSVGFVHYISFYRILHICYTSATSQRPDRAISGGNPHWKLSCHYL
jgi:hypothetical protein